MFIPYGRHTQTKKRRLFHTDKATQTMTVPENVHICEYYNSSGDRISLSKSHMRKIDSDGDRKKKHKWFSTDLHTISPLLLEAIYNVIVIGTVID